MSKITLILPDIHNEIDVADKIIKSIGADQVICLGDFFDSYDDNFSITEKTIEWVKEFVQNPKHIACWGNHDLHYGFPQKFFRCSGFTEFKFRQINDRIPKKLWNKFRYYYILDDTWLISHAGLHAHNLPANIKTLSSKRKVFLKHVSEYLDGEILRGHRSQSWIFGAGQARGGFQRVGGLTWCDYNQEFYPITGLNQIVGHTALFETANWTIKDNTSKLNHCSFKEWTPTIKDIKNTDISINIDLDVIGNMHWAIWDGQKITIQNYKSL